VTHTIRIGSAARSGGWDLRCWWDRWLSGTRAFDHNALGDSRLPLAGVFAGAAAVRQAFAGVLADRNIRERDVTVSLWTPCPDDSDAIGNDILEWSCRVNDGVSKCGQVNAQFRFNPMRRRASEVVFVSAITDTRQSMRLARVQEEEPGGRGSGDAC
jgi:hypothetical protein